jgi:hypothetical protein
MSKQHLNAFSIATRSLECFGFRRRPRNVTSFFVDATLEPAQRLLGTALRLEQAVTTIVGARKIQKRLPIIDKLARGPEDLACRADVYIPLLVKRKVFPAECSNLSLAIARDASMSMMIPYLTSIRQLSE